MSQQNAAHQIASIEQVKEFLVRAGRDRIIGLAASHLGSLPKKQRRLWTGYLDKGTRLWNGRKVVLPNGKVATVCAARRGKVGVVWHDDFALTGHDTGLFDACVLKVVKLPAAVLLGRLKRGVLERKSERKAQACRRNATKAPRPGNRPRGRPPKGGGAGG